MSNQDYNSKSKDNAVEYALNKMESSPAQYKSTSKEKKYSTNKGIKSGGSVMTKVAHTVIPMRGDSRGEIVRKLFMIIAVIVFIGTLSYLFWELSDINKSNIRDQEIADAAGARFDFEADPGYSAPPHVENPILSEVTGPGTEEPEYIDLTPVVNTPLNINWENLWKINPDIKAWIKLTGTLINYPVVQASDNDYYLTHDVDHKESVSGAVFSSYRNTWDDNDDNKILFGHNMVQGTYFSYLVHYVPNDYSREPLAFYKKHPTIQMATPDGKNETFKVFAGMYVNTQEDCGEIFDYITKTKFADADDFNNYMLEIMDRSWFFTDVDLTYGDDILTLSTCSWPLGRTVCDTRWVVFARRVREGESTDVDTTVAKRNYNPRLFEYWYKVIGGKWRGRTWDTSKLLSY
ncbi:MAG: class B sortase [Oscillospiraceae bacterium]|nr:class B sortase [Oscillospiraceae bacterium]